MKEKSEFRTAGDMVSPGTSGKVWNSMLKALRVFRKRWYIFLLVFLTAFLALCVYHNAAGRHTASTVLSLDYEEASKGLTPNGMRFNVFEIRSPEVMERLIDYAELDGKISEAHAAMLAGMEAVHGAGRHPDKCRHL